MIAQTYIPRKKEQTLHEKRNIETGFPSPATDHLEAPLNLHDYVVKHPASTFFVEVDAEAEGGFGLAAGDLLVIDRSMAPRHNSLVIAEIDAEYVVCKVQKNSQGWVLVRSSGNTIPLTRSHNIWGKVTHIIHAV